ncbi:MAG: hypothetical protein KAI24_07735 [Planctomycetes bacterium]|nr:hypothetical protein [Planctomycetota bacterium]
MKRLLPASLCLCALLPAQDDVRDRVTLSNGRIVEGRVATPFALDELLVQTGGRRTRVPLAKVAELDTVAANVAQFFERRHRHRNSRRALRYLVDWAEKHRLPGLARLQATELVLLDDGDTDMHEFLGHRLRSKRWQWPVGSKWLTRDKLEASLEDRPLRLHGERFALTCDAGLLTNVRALFDLEQLAVTWFERFGPDLDLREVLDPIEVRTFRSVDGFPKWGFRPRPYFEPPPHGDVGRTFYSGPAPTRPEQLFFLGTQGLLYRTMIGQVDRQNSRDRVCAWLEVGLGMHMEKVMQGDAGFARPDAPKKLDLVALRALGRGYRLTHLVHLPMYASFYLTDDSSTATNWAAATMFVTWLLDKDNGQQTRDAFLTYVRAALKDRQGDSSTTFDRIMGRPIEQFDEPWRTWLNQVAGN